MAYLLIIVAAFVEGLIFSQFPIAGVVLPITILVLMQLNERFDFWQMVLFGALSGIIIDSIRSGYAPFFTLAYVSIAVMFGLWKKYRKRPLNNRIVRPLVFLLLAVVLLQLIIVAPILSSLSATEVLLRTLWMSVLLVVIWLSGRFVIARFST